MAWPIDALLHRRTDLSTFLVHFTRDYGGASAADNVLNMLNRDMIEARSVYGMGRGEATDDLRFQQSQQVVCFTESPLEHAWMMCQEIQGRENGFAPYGLAFTKVWARSQHANPVWYIDISARGGADWLTVPINSLRDEAERDARASRRTLAEYPIARLLPFVEQMGPTGSSRKEFWWEREWRHVGHFSFAWPNVVAIFAPHAEHARFVAAMKPMARPEYPRPPLLDPAWGLERMISALRGVPTDEAGPLPPL
jgi:hypothetical protein